MIATFRVMSACLLMGVCACGDPKASAPQDKGVVQLKEKLWEAIRAKDAQKFVNCFFIEERFNTPGVRETNLKQVESLLGRETIDIEIEEIPPRDLADITKIQNAKSETTPGYSLFPKRMLRLRQKTENGTTGRRFLIGEQNGQWHIVTMAGHTT
jgi:hypothetical protein